MTLRMLGFSGLQAMPVSPIGAVVAAATPPQRKGQKGCVLGEAW